MYVHVPYSEYSLGWSSHVDLVCFVLTFLTIAHPRPIPCCNPCYISAHDKRSPAAEAEDNVSSVRYGGRCRRPYVAVHKGRLASYGECCYARTPRGHHVGTFFFHRCGLGSGASGRHGSPFGASVSLTQARRQGLSVRITRLDARYVKWVAGSEFCSSVALAIGSTWLAIERGAASLACHVLSVVVCLRMWNSCCSSVILNSLSIRMLLFSPEFCPSVLLVIG